MKRRLLCTDLDGTLIPNGVAVESPRARELFHIVAARCEVTLVYVTGRHLQLIESAIREYDLPRPAFAIGDVGTTIYEASYESWVLHKKWQKQLALTWPGDSVKRLRNQLATVEELTLQEPSKQNRFKVSYYARPETDVSGLLTTAKSCASQCGLEANLIWSIDHVTGLAMLDILPARANKLAAIVYLMDQLGFSVQDAIFAGDSGNDIDVFRSSIPSIVVANADSTIKRSAQELGAPQLYVASGRLTGLNGNYSAGVLEGTCHFWPEVHQWLQPSLFHLDPNLT